jgi:hypothetical protein
MFKVSIFLVLANAVVVLNGNADLSTVKPSSILRQDFIVPAKAGLQTIDAY